MVEETVEKKLTDEEIVEDVISHKKAAEAYGFVQITGKQMSIWLDLIHRLQEENKELKQEKNELQTLIRESRQSQSTAKEILQAMFYFLDGNSFWLGETGREVEYVKFDDALEFMRKQAKEYFVEVDE